MTMGPPIDDPLLEQVPEAFHADFVAIAERVDRFCDEYLDDECKAICRRLAANLCHPSFALRRSKWESWAAGVLYTLQWVNFLNDPEVDPHVSTETIAAGCGVSVPTVYAKGKIIREAFDVVPFDPDFVLPSRMNSQLGQVVALTHALARGGDELILPPGMSGFTVDPNRPNAVPNLDEEPPPAASHGYELQVTLLNTAPEVSRTLRVSDLTFEELHLVLQGAFDWMECHLHEFAFDGFRIVDEGTYRNDMHEPHDRPEWSTRLSQVLPDGGRRKPRFLYVYDFGDNWEHELKMTRVLHGEDVPSRPTCVGGSNAAPPEDCGGPWGYADLCDALADRTHPEHEQAMEWCGPLDPTAFRLEKVNAAIREWLPDRR